jgi:hypothetical protein
MIFLKILITWRISTLLINEDCPFGICSKFRDKLGITWDKFGDKIANNQLAVLFTCIYCLSIWVGLGVAFTFSDNLLLGLGYSGGAIITETVLARLREMAKERIITNYEPTTWEE